MTQTLPKHHDNDLCAINHKIKEILLDNIPSSGSYPTVIEGLTIYRREQANMMEACISQPSIAVIVQGKKHIIVGVQEFTYQRYDLFFTGIDMPLISYPVASTPEMPLLGFALQLDNYLLSQVVADNFDRFTGQTPYDAFIAVNRVNSTLLDAFWRLINLLTTPQHIATLAPLYIREIYYRLLMSPAGKQLQSMSAHGSQTNQLTRAITWLKNNYQQPLHIEQLAQTVNMSVPTFHRYFKKMTSLSPLQYQKRIRLHEARRLMSIEQINVSRASLTVGYESFTQFNREYKRLFGEPPYRDIQKITRLT